ncbi:MAG: hypothetical protein KDD62_01620 [Bdellovibrionales bacterium]|nr:hypothetical protein [Bdellovibrionales bacterium]
MMQMAPCLEASRTTTCDNVSAGLLPLANELNTSMGLSERGQVVLCSLNVTKECEAESKSVVRWLFEKAGELVLTKLIDYAVTHSWFVEPMFALGAYVGTTITSGLQSLFIAR